MNSVIELHDSSIVAMTPSENSLVIRFGPAYVHRSDGHPGIDPGSGWVQEIDLIISGCVVESVFTEWPQDLDDGLLQVGADVFENTIPLPLDVETPIRFSVMGKNGEWLRVRGTSATLVPIAEAQFVEDFPGN